MKVYILFVVLLCYRDARAATIVVPTSTEQSHVESQQTNATVAKPEMYYFHVDADIKYRFADTLISTRIVNPATVAQEVSFTAVLPETAFISGFLMEVDGKVYKAYVKEKEEAKHEYDQAVQQGQTAAHVALTARDSNRFTVSVNVEPQKKITFNLTYEELLTRKLGSYSNVINLDPGQVVEDFRVVVRIQENTKIRNLKVPALKTSNEIKKDSDADEKNALAVIENPTYDSAIVTFAPNSDQQRELDANGIKGQLVVEYDVHRTSHPGEFLVRDGYFVHFFSPVELPALRKQVTFVLDVSGSMSGRKIEQLRQAMTTILDNLNKDDLFSIVLFSETAKVWDPSLNDTGVDELMSDLNRYHPGGEEDHKQPSPSVIVKADPDNIAKAKKFVAKLEALSSTAIYDGLMKALEIFNIKRETREDEKQPEPMIIFLTDGLPNVRVSSPVTIVEDVTKLNTKNSSIYSLALGTGANFNFLRTLSLRNSGFARKIYEASDTALQLTSFYREVSSPLLANVTFKYAPEQVEEDTVTKNVFRRLLSGSEIVVAGKLRDETKRKKAEVHGNSTGLRTYLFAPVMLSSPEHQHPIIDPIVPVEPVTKHTPTAMERTWAYLTIQQLLEEDAAKDYDHNNNKISPEKQRALQLALQYSFVTPLTSLVVVKPNETKPVNTEDASNPPQPFGGIGFLSGASFASGPPQMGGFAPPAPQFEGAGFAARPQQPIFDSIYPVSEEDITAAPQPPELTTTAPARLQSLTDLAWLTSVFNNNTITLTTGANAKEILQLSSANETNIAHQGCTTPVGEPGHCRHLRFCVLDTFTTKMEDYLPYLCHINTYAGVCCPDYI